MRVKTQISDLVPSSRGVADLTRVSVVLIAAVIASVAAGAALGASIGSQSADPDLALVIRFMAFVKAALAIGAAGLVYWRLKGPLSPSRAYGYIAAAALMAFSPGLVWFTASPMLASIAFHGGLLSGLILAFRDDGLGR
jgi:hypothetical protein